ncbi:MAG TPA: porin, partial [Labilithrix sp.]
MSAASAQDAVPPGGGEPPPPPPPAQPYPPYSAPPAPPPAEPQPLPPSNERGSDTEYPLAQEPSPEEHARIDNSPVGHDTHPLAGYQNGLFYLRDHHDDFNLYIQGRMQLDWYSFFGPGVPDTTLKPTLFVRRLRPEISGDILQHWRFQIAGDMGATAIDNPKGTNQTAASNPGATPSGTSAKYAAAQSTRIQAAVTDAFISYRPWSNVFNVQVGQFDAPFTMENRTSDKYLQFMERSIAVRDVGIPTNKDIGGMFWGETKDRFVFYSVGPFMGEGQNRPNVDSRMDVYGRAFIHPFANVGFIKKDDPLRDVQIGGSFHYGSRD